MSDLHSLQTIHRAESTRYYWYLGALYGLAIFISQITLNADLMGLLDALSVSLLLFALLVGSSLMGKIPAALMAGLLMVFNLAVALGSHVYLGLYQAYAPFSILHLAPESAALIGSFPLWMVLVAVLLTLIVFLSLYQLKMRVAFPPGRARLRAVVFALSAALSMQLLHDSRPYKHFNAYSESPLGHFLRSGGFIPFVIGSPFDERWANINAYAQSLKKGVLTQLPEAYQLAIDRLLPGHEPVNAMYPLFSSPDHSPQSSASDYLNPEPAADKRPENVIVIVLESFRASESGIYGNSKSATPYLDQLAGSSLLASRFYSNAPLTSKSETAIHCSVLDYFGGNALSMRGDFPALHCLPDILKQKGYETLWFHGHTKAYYDRVDYLPKIGFEQLYGIEDFYDESFNKSFLENAGRDAPEHPVLGWGMPDSVLFDRALQRLTQLQGPFYAEILSLSNHLPFTFDWGIEFPDYLQSTQSLHDRYRRGMYYTDQALKGFMEKFRASGLYKNTLVVITGDHGIWTFDQARSLSELNKHEQFFRVPLLVHAKDIEPAVVDTPSSHVDIAPTLLSMLGMSEPAAFMGRSMLEKPDQHAPVFTLLEATYGVRLGDQVCVPSNACFRDGEEICEAHQREWKEKGSLQCFDGGDDNLFDAPSRSIAMSPETRGHIDNLLNYMMLGLQIGFVPQN